MRLPPPSRLLLVLVLLPAALVVAQNPAQGKMEADMLGSVRLATHPACAADVHRICVRDPSLTLNERTPNIDIIGCLLDKQEERQDASVSPACHTVLWQLRRNLTRSTGLVKAVASMCPNQKFEHCDKEDPQPGHYISCVMEHFGDVENDGCADFLENLGVMIFSDYRMIYRFAEDCDADITKHQCGRLEKDTDEEAHSQGMTVECLSEHVNDLADSCKLQVLRVAELQAEDYHLDRPLYFACREDRERFCANTVSGDGKVHRCLLQHKMEKEMSTKCRQQLTRRQKLTSVDYRVAKRLWKACQPVLEASKCHEAGGVPADSAAAHSVKLSFVLLCMESHEKSGHPVDGECARAMTDQRRALMEDYTISPEVVSACKDDINRLCDPEKEEREGTVIHCLMLHSNPARVGEQELVSGQCQRQVEDLLKAVEVPGEWRVDPVLRAACAPVVAEACSDVPSSEVMFCLADARNSPAMTPDCDQVLLQILYFVSRDFKLDPQLYKSCNEDAAQFCHASERWWVPEADRAPGAETDPANVLSCLYRNIYHHEQGQKKVSDGCRVAVRRVMKYRADEVDLHPRVQQVCIADMAKHCFESSQRGHEMLCLQDNYNQLSENCRKVMKEVTQDEAQNIDLHPEVARVCKHVIKQNCMRQLQAGGDDGVMECLIQHKSDLDVRHDAKCWAAINHFQIISLNDYSFSPHFQKLCKAEVDEHCPGKHTKADVIRCLSELMLSDTLDDKTQRVSKECRRQVQSQLRQRAENEELDPRLNAKCGADIHRLCRDESESKGSGKVLECLRDHVDQLSESCSKLLFRRQQQSMILPRADYFLFTACKGMILKYCSAPEHSTGAEVLDCLKAQTEDASFDPTCGEVVSRRLAEQKRDYRLHPALRSACLADAEQHCAKELSAARSGEGPAKGRVTACLARALRRGQLSEPCGRQIDLVLREAARDYRQDPLLAADCGNDIAAHCRHLPPAAVGECLRLRLAKGEPLEPGCMQRVARLVEDVNVDVHTDPQLSAACALDLQRSCAHVPAGNGAQLLCLKDLHDPTARCADMLALRMKMMSMALKVRPAETVQDLYATVRDSPSRSYFLVLVSVVLVMMFMGGLCCGRATKQANYLQKMK